MTKGAGVSGGPFALDESQLDVTERPAQSRCLVIAGAGQGKTEVVAARLSHLVTTEGLNPSDEVLVLSFSRAAVAAARARLQGRGAVARVAVRTFDSFATRLLSEAGAVLSNGGFDARIRQATRLLAGEEPLPTLDLLRHVIVDEVQDLVGDRAQFVAQLLERVDSDCGFTVLGDPLQAIYDFQLEDAKSKSTSADLMTRIQDELSATPLTLTGHYRALSSEAQSVVELSRHMRQSMTAERRLDLAVAFTRNLPSAGTLADLPVLLRRWNGTTAVLCRTNGQAMEVSLELARAEIGHRLRRPSEELSVPPWVALTFASSPARILPKSTVLDLVGNRAPHIDPEFGWRLLKATERRRRSPNDLDLVELSSRIAARDIPVDLADDGSSLIVVSTVHRAKGLEFDNVILVEEVEAAEDAFDADRRARELFVGVSRARSRIATFSLPRHPWIYRETQPPGRWIRTGRRGRWVTSGFELRGGDVQHKAPARGPGESAVEIQARLASGLRSATLAEGTLDVCLSNDDRPVYRLTVDAETVGYTNDDFGHALAQRLNRAWPNHPGWPSGLRDIVIDSVESVAGSKEHGIDAGVGSWGLWLAVKVGGLTGLMYEGRGTEESQS